MEVRFQELKDQGIYPEDNRRTFQVEGLVRAKTL